MELFGKELNIDLDNKKIKILILIGTGIGVLLLINFLIVSPIQNVFSKRNELIEVKKVKTSTTQNLELFKKKNEKSELKKGEQREELEKLVKNFRSKNLKDEARLKQMVQDILNYLDIELLEIGKSEVDIIEGKIEYQKRMLPYVIKGKASEVALFFYYLENSKVLLTLKNSRLEVTSEQFDGNPETAGIVTVKFKLGYYKILGKEIGDGKEEEEGKKEEVEKKEELENSEVEDIENPLSDYITAEVYISGIEKFYSGKDNMFSENANQFLGEYEGLKTFIETKFKVTTLITHGGKSSAVLHYTNKNSQKRAIVEEKKIIKLEEESYYIEVFKDHVDIKKGENGQTISLYPRERW